MRAAITPHLAHCVFDAEVDRFREVFPRLRASLTVVRAAGLRPGCRERDVADANPATGEIRVVARLLDRGLGPFLGVIKHELGHLCDSRVHEPEAEARADMIALLVAGAPVKYDAIQLQTTGRGTWPRPRSLHR